MSSADQAAEPTMDEILASIRRIIADDPVAENGDAAGDVDDDVLDLSDALIAEPQAVATGTNGAEAVASAPIPPQARPDVSGVQEHAVAPPPITSAPVQGEPVPFAPPPGMGLGADPRVPHAQDHSFMGAESEAAGMPPPPVDFDATNEVDASMAPNGDAGMLASLSDMDGPDFGANVPPIAPGTAPRNSTSQMPLDFSRDVEAELEKAAMMSDVGGTPQTPPHANNEGMPFGAAPEAAPAPFDSKLGHAPMMPPVPERPEDVAASLLQRLETDQISAADVDSDASTSPRTESYTGIHDPNDPLAGLPDIISQPMSGGDTASSDPLIAGMSSAASEEIPVETPSGMPGDDASADTGFKGLKSSALQSAVFAQMQPMQDPTQSAPVDGSGDEFAHTEMAAPVSQADKEADVKDVAADTPSSANADGGPKTLEQSIQELLKPMLREWLDDNMPRIVEGVVKSEMGHKK